MPSKPGDACRQWEASPAQVRESQSPSGSCIGYLIMPGQPAVTVKKHLALCMPAQRARPLPRPRQSTTPKTQPQTAASPTCQHGGMGHLEVVARAQRHAPLLRRALLQPGDADDVAVRKLGIPQEGLRLLVLHSCVRWA